MKKRVVIIILLIVSVIASGYAIYRYINLPISINKLVYFSGVNADNSKTVKIDLNIPNILPVTCTINGISTNSCVFNLTNGSYTLNVKNAFVDSDIDFVVDSNEIISVSFDLDSMHIAIGEEFTIIPSLDFIGNPDTSIVYTSSNDSVATVNENGIVTGISTGEAVITGTASNGVTNSVNFIVTDMIVKPVFNLDKQKLPCGVYTKDDNDTLDALLKERVDYAGRGTRGGTIAAARFLTLSFAYKVPYFFESGRLDNFSGQKYVDGEGRYHHLGLYLDPSRYESLVPNAKYVGPKTWGCGLRNGDDSYGWAIGALYPNGLDCSGFVTWAFLNGGTDVGDIGAGITEGIKDMSDLGIKHDLTYEFANSDNYKIGDVIARNGHTALIVGKDDEYLYIAESLLYGVRTVKYSYTARNSKLYSNYEYIEDMDNVYSGEGKYTTMFQIN